MSWQSISFIAENYTIRTALTKFCKAVVKMEATPSHALEVLCSLWNQGGGGGGVGLPISWD